MDDIDLSAESLVGKSAWDVAIRYHDFKSRPAMKKQIPRLRSISAQAVIARAKSVLGSVSLPTRDASAVVDEVPVDAANVELDIEMTIDEGGSRDSEIWMSYRVHRKQSVIVSVDTSLSMTGEKLALTAVALAVVLLQFPEDPIGVVAFESRAQVLKRPDEVADLQQLIERFLDVPAQGYTDLECGLKKTLKMMQQSEETLRTKRPATLLLTDGKYTAGRDPSYLASGFSQLIVMKMGNEKSSLDLCRELAHKGAGSLREVRQLSELPKIMYDVVRDVLRGATAIR